MEQVQILAIEDVLAAATQVKYNTIFEVDGIKALRTTILQLVLDKGCTCAGCGADALYFAALNTESTRGVSNLKLMFDHTFNNGEVAYMTIDHIVPKSKGGPNHKNNYQPMCVKCNRTKNDDLDIATLPTHLVQYVAPEFRQPTPVVTSFKDDYEVLMYKAYIRWFTITFHRKDHIIHWSAHIRGAIRNALYKSKPDFSPELFNRAFSEVYDVFNLPKSANEQRKIRPGQIWANENKNKSLTK